MIQIETLKFCCYYNLSESLPTNFIVAHKNVKIKLSEFGIIVMGTRNHRC